MEQKKFSEIIKFEGLISAPFTAFGKNGEIDVSVIPQYVTFLENQGVKGVFVNGTTGEGQSLTVEERKLIAEAWMKAGQNTFKLVIIHVGANSIKDAQELAEHAEKLEVSAIASLPPLFYKPQSTDHLLAYMKAISSSARKTPLMLYHIPSFSGVEISVAGFLEKARKEIPTFCGAKFTSVDVRDLLKCHRLPGEPVKLLSGFDEVLLPCLASGVTAAVGASYNFMAPLSLRIINAFKKGDNSTAFELQEKVHKALEFITSHGQSISCLKAAMNELSGMDFGPPRLPLLPLEKRQLEDLRKGLRELGAEKWKHIA